MSAQVRSWKLRVVSRPPGPREHCRFPTETASENEIAEASWSKENSGSVAVHSPRALRQLKQCSHAARVMFTCRGPGPRASSGSTTPSSPGPPLKKMCMGGVSGLLREDLGSTERPAAQKSPRESDEESEALKSYVFTRKDCEKVPVWLTPVETE